MSYLSMKSLRILNNYNWINGGDVKTYELELDRGKFIVTFPQHVIITAKSPYKI